MEPQLGRYKLIRLLATGGMGEVFLARQEGPAGFTKTLVIKRILRHLATDQNFIDLFLNEARLAAQLQHPHIVQVFGLEHEDNAWFIAMEYVHGKSLREVVTRARELGLKVPPRLAARLASQALQGLHYAHELTDERGAPLGILHRDVTPENLLVSFAGNVKLADFGIARAMTGAVAQLGRPRGKAAYMAPESQAQGAAVDRRADVFGLGVVLAEMLLLTVPERPWRGERSLPEGLNAVLSRALAEQPEARFGSALEMSTALEAFLVSTSQPVVPDDVAGFLDALWGPEVRDSNPGVPAAQITANLSGVFPAPVVAPPTHAAVRDPAHERRQVLWSIAVGAVTAALIGFVVLLALWPAPPQAPVPAAVVLAPPPQPLPVPLPAPSPAPDAGAPAIARVATDDVDAGAAVPPKAKVRTGRVTVKGPAGVEVWLGARRLGVTPFAAVDVPAGRQLFVLKRQGLVRRVPLRISPGGNAVLKADLPRK